MKKYQLTINDIDKNYFHFTWKKNLDSIKENGLLPRKGNHAKYIEKNEKVFFVEGLDNLLILFDCWINVYKKVPILPNSKITYGLGSKLMQSKYFPMSLVDFYFKLIKNNRYHKKHAYKIFDELLDNCILLNLNIKEGIDFSLLDVDEIKSKGYRKRHLIELGYSEKYSDMSSNKMDKWNLHTKKDKGIESNKIKLCFINNSCSIRDILNYALDNTNLDIENVCPVLYDYLDTIK